MHEKKKDFENLILETVDEELKKNLRKSGNSCHLRLPREQSFTKERRDRRKNTIIF